MHPYQVEAQQDGYNGTYSGYDQRKLVKGQRPDDCSFRPLEDCCATRPDVS